VLGLDQFLGIVEINKVTRQHIHGADREAGPLFVDEREIHQFQQRVAQRRAVVVARRRGRTGEAHPGIGKARREKAGLPGDAGD
jgi:hypothetical protein